MKITHWKTTLCGAALASPFAWLCWNPGPLSFCRWLFGVAALGALGLGLFARDRDK